MSKANGVDAALKALQSISAQCGNVIYNCCQRPADNERHLDSWVSVKAYADATIKVLEAGKLRSHRRTSKKL